MAHYPFSLSHRKAMNTDLNEAITIIAVVLLIVLFWGTPDLMDVIMHRLSDGQIPIPAKP